MISLLVRTAAFLATAAVGLLVAAAVMPGFRLSLTGLVVAVAVFAIVQDLASHLVTAIARRYVPGLVWLAGLVSTLAALLVANLVADGISIEGGLTWVLATLIVWAVSALAAWLIPLVSRSRTAT